MNSLFVLAVAAAVSPNTAPTDGAMTSARAMELLQAGNHRYTAGLQQEPGHDAARRAKVAGGQYPHTVVVTCADSRVSPELLFDQGLGDLFVIRVAGNVVDTHAIASIEYAAEHLHTPLLVVMGHERCGAVAAALDAFKAHKAHSIDNHQKAETHTHNPEHDNIHQLLNKIMPAVSASEHQPGDFLANAVDQNVKNTIADCWLNSHLLQRLGDEGKFTMLGAVYDLDTGKVQFQSATNAGVGFVRVHK